MDIIAEKKFQNASQIYYCLVKSVLNNQCVIMFNNKQYTVPFFGSTPIPNKTYILFLPQNNMNQAFIIGEAGIEIKDDEVSQHETWSSSKIRDFIYPVGSIYMSTNNISPATIFGGTWVQIQDRFLLAAGSSYTAGDTGGEASHTLTKSELPAEKLGIYVSNNWLGYKNTTASAGSGIAGLGYKDGTELKTGDMGSGQAHNNMPPYLVVYVWARTA